MKSKFLYWAPRVLSIIFILFLSMFSLDIFEGNYGFWGTILGLFMHNIPVIILLILLIISWKYDFVGGIVFILAGVSYIVLLLINPQLEWYMFSWAIMISGPAFIVGILWILSWKNKKKINRKKRRK